MKMVPMAHKINEDAGLVNSLFKLYERWLDERECEDINDYLEAVKKKIPEAIKATKKPFGFIIKCEDGNLHASIKQSRGYAKLFYKKARG